VSRLLLDVFMYRDEADVLEMRLREFEDLDVHHVLVESPVSHRGEPKPLHFAENAGRFAPWKDRVTHIVASGLLPGLEPWPREHAQRDAALATLEDLAEDSDIVVIADVDEFWPQGFGFAGVRPVVAFDQRLMMYAVDWAYPELHRCTVAATWRYVKASGGLAAVRDQRGAYRGVPGGWHLTWLGGTEAQREKLRVTCHTEMTAAEYDRIWSGACYERGVHHGGQYQMIPVDVDESWPQMIWRRECPQSWFRPRKEPCG
jgi:Glycosyltransferase family 17